MVRGRVQGVGFRYTVLEIARRFPVSGTVCNLRTGEVEIDVEGDDAAVDAFVNAVMQTPPRGAHVDGVTRKSAEPRYVDGFNVARDR